MTTGALIFAINNSDIDYLAMASWSADNISRHLKIPTSVVTNCADASRYTNFDKIIQIEPGTAGKRYFSDFQRTVDWYNASRVNAYDLTPYDQTLLLDADFVVASSQLRTVLQSEKSFLCHKDAFDLSTGDKLQSLNKFGNFDMPMWWATVIMFRKSNLSRYIFDCVQMIKQNWQHYCDLYCITRSTYRNDFALSIALSIVNGHNIDLDVIPWDLASLLPDSELTSCAQDNYTIKFFDQNKKHNYVDFFGIDFHAMGKKHLGELVANSC